MTRKLCILDKDGTLVRPAFETFVQNPKDQEPISGVKEAIERMRSEDYTFAICSNQGGIAAGYKTLEEAIEEMRFCLKLLFPNDAVLAYFCPDFEGKTCYGGDWRGFEKVGWKLPIGSNFRKPGAGMLQLAMKDDQATEAIMIGDRDEDKQAAEAAGVEFMWAETWRSGGKIPF